MSEQIRVIVNPERADVLDEIADLADAVDVPDEAAGLADAAERAVDRDAADGGVVDGGVVDGGVVDGGVVDGGVVDGGVVIAAVGGDGTQRTVAAALAHRDAALVVVPAGTVNLLGQVHGIRTVADARRAITDGRERRLDLGSCNGEPFLLNASSGCDAQVIGAVGDRAKRFGRLGYGAVGIRCLAGARPEHVRVTVDGDIVFSGSALTVLVMNVAARGSTRFELAPGAAPDDGRLHAVIVRDRRALVRGVWALLRRRMPDATDIRYADGSVIEVEWDVEVAAQRDGDPSASGRRFRYEVDPGAVAVRVPA